MRHENVHWNKKYAQVGQMVAIYPPPWRGHPFVGKVDKIVRNKFGRVSYHINGKMWFAEELFPGKNDKKLRIRLEIS